MNTESVRQELPRREILLSQLDIYLGIYKQHFDMAFKGVVLYLAVSGVFAGYLFKEGLSKNLKISLCLVIVFGSIIAIIALALVCKKWVSKIEQVVNSITKELEIEQFPFSGARNTTNVMISVASFLGIIGLATLFWGI